MTLDHVGGVGHVCVNAGIFVCMYVNVLAFQAPWTSENCLSSKCQKLVTGVT